MSSVTENCNPQALSVAILDGGLEFEMAEVGGSANWIARSAVAGRVALIRVVGRER